MDRLLAADLESLVEEAGEQPTAVDPRLLAGQPNATETLQ
jgi:hypothetical protein